MNYNDLDTEERQSGNRATVALLDAKLDTVRVEQRLGFEGMQHQLDPLAGMPVTVADLKAQNRDQEKRITKLESVQTAGAEWRRTHLPALLIAAASLLASITFILVKL